MRIQHNIMAMNAYRNYTNNVTAMKSNLEKLSSGYKINRAGDDAAGLAISEKMRAQITGLETAQKNAKDGISLVQTAEGALTEVHDMLNRMVELATQSANGTYDNTTDRAQMQKEIDQLLSEINRIADSSNFNGIKLLDGTLGLNTDAFTVGTAVGGADLVEGMLIEDGASAAASTAGDTHISDLQSLVEPSFSIDLADYAIEVGTADDVTATIAFGDVSTTITLAKCTEAGKTKTYTASDIATAFVTAFASGTDNDGGDVGAVKGLMFSAVADGSKVNFTYAGVATTNKAEVDAAASLGSTEATAFNALYGGAVTVTTDTKEVGTTGRINCDILNPKEAVAPGNEKRAGITFTLASSAIADGNTITIDGKTFTIQTEASNSKAEGAENIIDVSAGTDAAAQMRLAILQLANATAGNFTIHTVDPDNGKFHLEQTVESFAGTPADIGNNTPAVKGDRYDYDKLSKLVEVRGPATAAKNAGTQLTVVDDKIKEGNVISVGTDKFVAGKDFNTAEELKTAIEGAGYTVDSAANDDGNTVLTIRAKNAADPAPTILGKGLTLQIGDTADSFNQLNVAVQDMHAASLGIADLKIDTEEAAQVAIDKIKAAINSVSDVRGTLGATQNRLDHTINNLSVMTENIQDAESTIRDVDVAEEMMAYTKNNILIQSAQAMLAQANQVPQGVLQLLQ